MSYLGNEPLLGLNNRDRFTGTGSQTVFTLSRVPAQAEGVLVMVSGVVQDSLTYSCAAKTLTFTEAPPAPFPGTGLYNIEVVFLGKQGSPYTANWNIPIADNSGTADAIAASFNPAITALTDNLVVKIVLSAANTVTNPTFNPNGLGALAILNHTGSALLIGELSGTIELRYESSTTSWRAISSSVEVFPTPTQFNSSTLGATTEFVQRAIGGLQNNFSYGTGGQTIPPSQVNSLLNLFGTCSTITLPLVSSVRIGSMVYIAQTSLTCTINRQGTDTIWANATTTSLTSVQVQNGGSAIFTATAGGWALVGGTSQLIYSSEFAFNLTGNGYQKLPSGLIIQWGNITNTGATDTVTFAIAFPTSLYSIATSQANGAGQMGLAVISATTTSNFTLKSYIGAPGAVLNAATASQINCNYIAIGK